MGELFSMALNNRFFKISRRPKPPFYDAGTLSEEPCRYGCGCGYSIKGEEEVLTTDARSPDHCVRRQQSERVVSRP